MKLKTIITILLALIALTGQAQAIPQDWFKADTILARGLHGEDIEKKLTEVFSNKK